MWAIISKSKWSDFGFAIGVSLVIYMLLSAVWSIGFGFANLSAGSTEKIFSFATQPLVGLVCGILATALVQSSSTVSSSVVAMVAGGMPVSVAIPIILGSNLGTSLSSTFVSLGHIKSREDFSRAFAAATIHDSFNLLAVLVFFPLEYFFHPLARLTHWMTNFMPDSGAVHTSSFNPMSTLLHPVKWLMAGLADFLPITFAGALFIVLGLLLLFGSIKSLTTLLKGKYEEATRTWLQRSVGRGPVVGMSTGGLITIILQSSSVTSSLIVPLAGTGLISLRQVYPYTLGTNIGTTFTAILASLAISGPLGVLAFQIALVHFFFNVFAVGIIYSVPFLKGIPLQMASFLSRLALINKWYVLVYILSVFFVIPALLLALSYGFHKALT